MAKAARRCGRHTASVLLWIGLTLFALAPASATEATSSICARVQCGLHADGFYPNLVIGTVARVGTDADMKQVFRWARHHSYWHSLSASVTPYLKYVKLISIRLPASEASQPITVFMQIEEFTSAPLVPGELVRYSPHGIPPDVPLKGPAEAALYHGLTGCVATLCRQSDRNCYKRYEQGVFTKKTGQQVNLQTGDIVPGGHRINPVSLLPEH